MRICIAQINYSSENIHRHYERITGIIEAHRSCDLIVFPELILHGHPSFERPEGFLYRKMKVVYSTISRDLYRFVERAGARVIIGELKRKGDDYFNVATYIDGGRIESYVKSHVHWTEHFVPGTRLKVFDSPFGGIGVNICFDAAFSEVWRVLALKGAWIVVNIAAVPGTFPVENMWRRFTGAAVFNQIFVVYANRPGGYFGGYSAVFGPRGERLANAGADEEVFEVEIDPARVIEWRREEDIYANRRPLLYRDITHRHKA
ncbi:carbon-nitrogen hydrolase family protein [Desulfatiglans anilini]|uniref:carbon-nitrogen hydrolase family protein n=1 Tax=Desulfatiglans anilini TaxID=90728 RepID=UPI0004041F0A|nr:carbon-nitrogen hydrolase family protein [Desulfatiglans anilini]